MDEQMKVPLCSTGHRPLRGRCPATHHLQSPTYIAGQRLSLTTRVRQSAGAREHCSKTASCFVGSRAKKRGGKRREEKRKKEGKRKEKRKKKKREKKREKKRVENEKRKGKREKERVEKRR